MKHSKSLKLRCGGDDSYKAQIPMIEEQVVRLLGMLVMMQVQLQNQLALIPRVSRGERLKKMIKNVFKA
jgi:hypothetical protein